LSTESLLKLAPVKCKYFDVCKTKIIRTGWDDHRKICVECKRKVQRLRSKFKIDMRLARWIPEHLRGKIHNIEEGI